MAALGVSATPVAGAAGPTGPARVPLHGHQGVVPPGATLVGPAPASTALSLDVTLEPRDPAALAAEAQAVSDPRSPHYRHFLTSAQFAQEFGPTPATIARVAAALRREGLMVGSPAATGLSLPVSGTVAQVQSAFATPISKYRLSSGKTGYDNSSAPEVPSSVAPQIEGILGLDTLSPPQPSTSVPEATQAVPHAESDLAAPALAPGQPTPTGTTCTNSIEGVEDDTGALDAPQLAQAYSFDPLYSSGDYGTGSTIALVEMSGAGYVPGDINEFAKCYGVTPGEDQRGASGRGRRHRTGHGGSRTRHRHGALHGAQGEHRGVRRRRQHVRRVQPDRQRRHGKDRERQLDERVRGLRGPVAPELREHALPGGRRQGAVDLRRHRGPGVRGLQHQRGDRRVDGNRPRGAGRRSVDRHPVHRQQVE